MSDGIIRPARGVQVPMPNTSQSALPGIGGRANPTNPYGLAVDPLAQMRAMVDQPNVQGGQAGGTIKWEQYGDARFEDQALRDLRNESNIENDVNQVYVQKYAAACSEFTQFLCARRGLYYDEFRNVLESFRNNLKTHMPCQIRNEFVDTVNRHPELIQGIARAAAPMYGQRLINIAKTKQTGEAERNDYIGAIHFSVRCVLTMEMISWLCKTPQGRQKAYSLTEEIKQMVGKLEVYKDAFGVACATFGVTNPYAGLVYDVQLPTRTDIQLIAESQTAFMYNDYSHTPGVDSQNQTVGSDIYKMIQRNANKARSQSQEPARYVEAEDETRWDKFRSDFQNLTPRNKKDYDYRRFFHYIGKENHYMVPESDWKTIKHAFKRHADQPAQEETVLHGCFRVVIIDLEHDDGWFSTVVRAEGLDMPTVLTNPNKLLPLLEGEEGGTNVIVKQLAVEEALGKKNKTLEIPLETCAKLEGIPVITVKELIATNSSKKLNAAVLTSNDQMTQNFKTVNATSFNTVIWETYTCDDPSEKTRLMDDLPFLFRDLKEEAGRPLTFFQKCHKLNNYFREALLSDELMTFIDNRLTIMVNEWLVSCLGYDNDPNSARHLSVSSIVRFYDDLDKALEEDGEDGFNLFNAPSGPENYLTEQMRIFTAEDKYDSVGGDQGMIQKAQKLQELIMERPIYFAVVNKRHGPIAESNGEPLVIKRSKFPEYFDLVEKGFEPTMGVDKNIRVTDKVLQFSQDEHLWLFSYTAIDRNVATLRRVSRRQSLLFLSLI